MGIRPKVKGTDRWFIVMWRHRGRLVRAPELKSGGRVLKSFSDHLAEVVSR